MAVTPGDQSWEKQMDPVRCPACGCAQTTVKRSDAGCPTPTASDSCEICGVRLHHDRTSGSLEPSRTPPIEIYWTRRAEQRRVERWIWFGFLAGLVLALAVIATPF